MQLRIEPDQRSRGLIDEQSGIIVMGDDVRVRRVTDTPQVLQPTPPLEGETARPTSRSGGIGDADANLQEMLKVQEVA